MASHSEQIPHDTTIRLVSRETLRTGRYALVGAELSVARRVWFALHGYGQLAPRFLRRFEGVVPPDTCVVAPEGLSRFYADMPRADGSHMQRVGATWMTREAREDDIADTLRWLDGVLADVRAAAPQLESVGVLAFSQGVATAMRWIAHGTVQPKAFVVWAGGPAHDVDSARMRAVLTDARVTLVIGDADQFIAADHVPAALEAARALQPNAQLITFAGDHRLDSDVLAALLPTLGQ